MVLILAPIPLSYLMQTLISTLLGLPGKHLVSLVILYDVTS